MCLKQCFFTEVVSVSQPLEESNNPSERDDIRIWEKIIDVQMHFNEIKSKNQTLFVSIITTSLAGAGFLYKPSDLPIRISFGCSYIPLHLYTLPILGAVVFTLAFYILDYGIYHRLLKGAVKSGQKFENEVLGLELTSIMVKKEIANHRVFGLRGAGDKQKAFYALIALPLLALFIVLNWWAVN